MADGEALRAATQGTADDPIAEWRRFGLTQHGRVAIVGFRDAAIPIELDHIFVPLQVHADPGRRGDGRDRHADTDNEALGHGGAEISLDEALVRASRGRTCLALIGDPGAGKTTLLRHLFRRAILDDVAGPVTHLRGLHPVLVRLATVADAELVPRGLRAILARVTTEDGYPEAGRALLARPNQGFLFLLDGLDEVRDEPTRERLCAWLNKEVDHWPACGFVVTSRRAAWARTPALGARFLPVSVLGMRGPERELYVRRWFRAVVRHFYGAVDHVEAVEARAATQATALLDVLSRGAWSSHPRLLEMVANPLMLSTLCLAHYNDTRLPEQRGALYERTLGLLIEVWTRERVGGPTLRLESTRLVLQPLAHAMHEQDRRELSVAEAAALVGPPLAQVPQVRAVAPTPERFLDLVRDECGVLKSRDLGRIEFVHLSFQEYLTACHVAARGLGRQLADRAGDPRWEEVILLAMSRDGVFEPFMTRILERGNLDLALLRQCLREAPQIIPEPFEAAADRLQARLRAPAGPLSRLGRWLLGRPVLPAAEDELRRLFELVAGFDLPGMVDRARSFVDSDDRALRAATRNLVDVEDASGTEARESQPFMEPVTQMTFVWVPSGSFLMGSSTTRGELGYDRDATDDEMPVHEVRLTGFWMGVYPVTNEQYARYMAETGRPAPESFADRRFNDPAQPVVAVSWQDATAFTRWLTGKLVGIAARLPTEAEWEYAARGTDGRRYPWGNEQPDSSRATFDLRGDSGRPAVVGHTPSGVSPFGVHDLAGNVWEWCLDTWTGYAELADLVDPCHQGDTRSGSCVVRGGSWSLRAALLRSAYRLGLRPQVRILDLGFRVVCVGARQPETELATARQRAAQLDLALPVRGQNFFAAGDRKHDAARRRIRFGIMLAAVLTIAVLTFVLVARDLARQQRIDDKTGTVDLALEPFDRVGVPAGLAATPRLSVTLYSASADDLDQPGEQLPTDLAKAFAPEDRGVLRVQRVRAPGGTVFLRIDGRGDRPEPCGPSWIRIQAFPAYHTHEVKLIQLWVPTCEATLRDTVTIEQGPFVYGGAGERRSQKFGEDGYTEEEQIRKMATFAIDRTEVSNASYEPFAQLEKITGYRRPIYPPATGKYIHQADPSYPVTNVNAFEAQAFCAYMGKHLPSEAQWIKAARGGLQVRGQTNPAPRRLYPWGTTWRRECVNLEGTEDGFAWIAPADSLSCGQSPYGVLNLVGNVNEWIAREGQSDLDNPLWALRGGAADSPPERDQTTTIYRNHRDPRISYYTFGLRCVVNLSP
jgi:formylglycine-generating enzyme required for sulfatase activity